MANHKDQHVIPCSYLAAWCDPAAPRGQTQTPYIWRILKDGTAKRKKSPKKSFTSAHRYTIKLPSGEKNLLLETTTLANLENQFVAIRGKICRQQKLTDSDRIGLCLFTAAMHSRTIRAGDNFTAQLEELRGMCTSLEQQHGTVPSVSNQVATMLENAPPAFVAMNMQIQTPLYLAMNMSVLVTDDLLGFITSDSPCLWFNPTAHTRPPTCRIPGLGQQDIEVTLPITPHHLLFLSRKNLPFYIEVKQFAVDEANRQRRAHCTEEFVSWKGETRPYWFEILQLPADAWENTDEGKEALRRQAEWDEMRKDWEDSLFSRICG